MTPRIHDDARWQTVTKMHLMLEIVAAINTSLGAGLVAVFYPDKFEVGLPSLLPTPDFLPTYILVAVLRLLLQFFVTLCAWGTVLSGVTFFIIFVCWGLHILSSLKARAPKRVPKHLRQMIATVYVYKCLQLSLILLNGIARNLLVYMTYSTVAILVTSLILFIGYQDQLNFFTRILIFFVTLVNTVSLKLVYDQLGDFNAISKKYVGQLRRSVHDVRFGNADKVLLGKYAQSLLPLRIELGSFGYFKKPNSLRAITMLLYYTMKGIMISRKIF